MEVYTNAIGVESMKVGLSIRDKSEGMRAKIE